MKLYLTEGEKLMGHGFVTLWNLIHASMKKKRISDTPAKIKRRMPMTPTYTSDSQRSPSGPPRISSGPQRVPWILDKTLTDLCAVQFRLVVDEVSA